MNMSKAPDCARLSAFYRSQFVLQNERPAMLRQQHAGLTLQHLVGGAYMAPEADTAHCADTQRFIDPIILQARAVNEWAATERNLAARRALRPKRSAAATRGWETRRGD